MVANPTVSEKWAGFVTRQSHTIVSFVLSCLPGQVCLVGKWLYARSTGGLNKYQCCKSTVVNPEVCLCLHCRFTS